MAAVTSCEKALSKQGQILHPHSKIAVNCNIALLQHFLNFVLSLQDILSMSQRQYNLSAT